MKTFKTLFLCLLAISVLLPAVSFAETKTTNVNNLPKDIQYVKGYDQIVNNLKTQAVSAPLPQDMFFYGKNFDPKNHIKSDKNDNGQIQASPIPQGILLGTCWYDQITPGTMPRHITTYSASATENYFNITSLGSAAGNAGKADFTSFGQTSPTYASMGTYYQFIDYTGAEPTTSATWKRIEKYPSYTGSAFNYNDGHIGFTSFLFPLQIKSLQIYQNADVGSEDFTGDSLTSTFTFFPLTAADGGNNIHTLYSHRITGETDFNEIGYKRSMDGGKTWSNELLMSGTNSFDGTLPSAASYLTYSIDAQGNKVIMAYIDRDLNFIYRKSTDNGITWSKPTLLWSLQYDSLYAKKNPDGTYELWTDSSAMCPGLIMDCMIDGNGDYHFACNVMIGCHVGQANKSGTNYTWIAGTDSIVWGKKYYPAIGFLYMSVPADTTVQPTYVFAGPPADGNFGVQQNYYLPFQYTHLQLNDSMPGTFDVADPQLAYDPDGNIYMTYTSIRDSINPQQAPDAKALIYSTNGTQYSFYNRHIFVTKYDKIAKKWSQPLSLSPNGWDCSYGSLSKQLVKKNGEVIYPLVYVADQDPTNWISFHNMFNMTSEPKLYFYTFKYQDYSNLGPKSVNDEGNGGTVMNVVPNPASEVAYVYYSNNKPCGVTAELYNMLGQKVQNIFNGYMNDGSQTLTIDVRNLSNGPYYCKISSGNVVTTTTVIVSR